MTENLLPCPFCGSKDLSITLSVTCNGCGARAAKVLWNTRLAAQADAPAIQPQRALEAAAERVCWFDWSNNDTDAVDAIEGLRKALAHTRPEGSTPHG